MLPDRVSNPGPLTYESGALPTALRGPASCRKRTVSNKVVGAVNRFYVRITSPWSLSWFISIQVSRSA